VIVGAHSWARHIATALKKHDLDVLLIDSNRHNEYKARLSGLKTYYGSVLSEHIFAEVELAGFGRLLALTPNDEANSLATLHFSEHFGRSEVYQLSPEQLEDDMEDGFSPKHLRGRFLFGNGMDYQKLAQLFSSGGSIKSTKLTEAFNFENYMKENGETTVPMFLISESGDVSVFTTDSTPEPGAGQTLLSLVSR
jgi:CPA1 family monovalent cation:H+ antiporter